MAEQKNAAESADQQSGNVTSNRKEDGTLLICLKNENLFEKCLNQINMK